MAGATGCGHCAADSIWSCSILIDSVLFSIWRFLHVFPTVSSAFGDGKVLRAWSDDCNWLDMTADGSPNVLQNDQGYGVLCIELSTMDVPGRWMLGQKAKLFNHMITVPWCLVTDWLVMRVSIGFIGLGYLVLPNAVLLMMILIIIVTILSYHKHTLLRHNPFLDNYLYIPSIPSSRQILSLHPPTIHLLLSAIYLLP